MIATAAENEDSAFDKAYNGLQGWVDCFEKATLKGIVMGGGIDDAGSAAKHKMCIRDSIDAAWDYMETHGIHDIVVHAPYIINLGNSVKPETYELAVEFLAKEIERTEACKSRTLILHPGAHVGAGTDTGIKQVIQGLNEVLTRDTNLCIALETMAGKGSELGRNFEELARIYDGVTYNEKLRVCFDTCHTHDLSLIHIY